MLNLSSPLKRSGSESTLNKEPVHNDSIVRIMKRCGSESDLNLHPSPSATDSYLDRLPTTSPYVGTFHRGFKASKGGFIQSFDSRPERLLKSCPYVGTFHRGYRASSAASSAASTEESNLSEQDVIFDKLMHHRPTGIQMFMDKIDSAHLPKSPELCGLQAILPRQCGVRILDKLGEGSFGKVVLAVNKRNRACWTDPSFFRKLTAMPEEGDSVVLKCVRKEGCYGAKGLQCVAREVEIHSRCCHPNISRMYGYYENGQYVTMILDFIEGKELFEILRIRRQLPEEEACLLILQVLRGVAYLHEKRIVHRDLTPRNIMVKPSGHALVIDLGLAVDLAAEDGDAPGKPLGSPVGAVGTMGYIPPESMRNEKITTAVDMWSVGVVLYEAVFGFAPFAPHEVMAGNPVEFPDPAWGASSDEMQDLVAQLLSKDAAARCTAPAALSHAWFRSAAAAADALAPPPTPEDAAESPGPGEEEPPPFWLLGGESRTTSGWSSSSELEPETPPTPHSAKKPAVRFLEDPPPSAAAAQHPRAQPREPSGGGCGSGPQPSQAHPHMAAGPEPAGQEEPGAAGRGAEAGRGKGRRECVLQLGGEIKCDAAAAAAGLEAGEASNVVFVARILKKTNAA